MFTDNNSESLSFLLWLIVFKSNINIGFVTNYMENGKILINTIFRYIDNFPQNLKPKIKTRNNSGFTLEKNVRFYVMSEPKHIEGKKFMYLFIDDFDIFNKLKESLLSRMSPKVPENIHKHIIYLV
jgi:hypothetical protein